MTGLKFYVTFDATEGTSLKNDPAQGSTGQYIGAVKFAAGSDVNIVDAENIKTPISVDGKVNEAKDILIESPTDYFWFMRSEDNYKTGTPFTVGSPKLYSLIKDAYIH